MKRLINFGSIEQFRSIVKNVEMSCRFVGLSETGEPIFDESIELPIMSVTGTEKIHGTNASVCFSNPDGFWVQSRENIITPEKDNAGCAFHANVNKDKWLSIIMALSQEYDIDLDTNIISVYYEWCGSGSGIKKNSAVSGLDKMSIIFKHFKVSPIELSEDIQAKWYETKIDLGDTEVWLEAIEASIFNIHNFPTVTIDVDFNNPKLAYKHMLDITEEVESNSGVAKYFNKPENIGEGWVWTLRDLHGNLLRWKTKGEKHSKTKVKILTPVDSVKEQIKIDFANYACPAWRLEQMFKATQDEFGDLDIKNTGDFLKRVVNDIIKEESDIMAERGLEPKEVNGYISKVARNWFIEQLNSSW